MGNDEAPFPVPARIAPFVIDDPKLWKNYYWCSCGMSRAQPFCDMSHVGTNFKPLKFILEEPTEQMSVCGCKLSTRAPFCDGLTCQKIRDGEEIKVDEDFEEEINEAN